MRALVDRLTAYAAYHRDARNIATHRIGIPLIVLAAAILLSRPVLAAGPVPITPALIVSAAAALFYLRLDLALGAPMALLLGLAVWAGAAIAGGSTALWLATGGGAFVAGWAIQFVGHAWEGRKPAFFDDIMGLLIGPLFIVAETLFALGLRKDLERAIEARLPSTPAG
jgi:uncharacterized membrane protein YGL010W